LLADGQAEPEPFVAFGGLEAVKRFENVFELAGGNAGTVVFHDKGDGYGVASGLFVLALDAEADVTVAGEFGGVVEQVEQVLGAAADDAAVLAGAATAADDEVGVAEDGGQRRAQVVADAGEEVAFGAAGLVGGDEGALQRAGAAVDGAASARYGCAFLLGVACTVAMTAASVTCTACCCSRCKAKLYCGFTATGGTPPRGV